MTRGVWIGLALACAVSPATAQTMNMEQAVESALQADPRISERRHLVDAARALLQEALGHRALRFDVNSFAGLAPGLEGGFYEGGASSCSALPCTPRSDAYEFDDGLSLWANVQFRVIKPLYTFGKIESYSEAAQGKVDVTRGDVDLERSKVRLQVTRAYYGYLAARDTRYLFEDVRQRLENAENLVQRWLRDGAGAVKQSDLYAVQTGLAVVNKHLAQARAVEQVALDGLKVLTGVGLDGELQVAERHIRPVPLPDRGLAALQQRALAKRPEMGQLEAGLRARRALVAASKAEKMPDLYVGLAGSLAYSPDRDRLDNPFIYDPFNYVGVTPVVGLRWEWASGVQPARVARAQAELEALVEKASFARRGIPFEVAEAYHQAHAHHKAVQELEQGSRAGRRWMIARYADFEAGLEEASNVLEAFQGYVLAHSDYLSTVNDYNVHVTRLKTVSGGYQ
ncbi:MAG: TolC family protein [Gammaproteobacteria bacterium]|nr:TolC family protein [Gammaproteobacteria bacterium]NIR96539.1 TolC family protein [Gammaproteobacteria bacterium]NIT62277.1 TolC family protein [Gammaproteobacteria bacterium]NIV19181.1 TolC family protein [Gammaproteobacteria bacterium]NIX10049.1 TolC family protein [Gammaproteobacteria bacterium]